MKQVIRIIEYIGEDEWIETTMEKSFISKEKPFKCGKGHIEEIYKSVKTLKQEDALDET